MIRWMRVCTYEELARRRAGSVFEIVNTGRRRWKKGRMKEKDNVSFWMKIE
jgi:hypothetical protein